MQVDPARVGPLSARHRLRRIDGRSREAKFLKATEAALVAQLGGQVTAAQRFIIERVATNLVRLELLDQKVGRGEELTELDGRIMHALEGAVRRGLKELGIKGPASAASKPKPGAALADHIQRRYGGNSAA